jgi:ubiquinone/menaquinone biosynthesis C-methylase UbiE
MRTQPGQKVLDVGCGPGTDTIPLAQCVGSLGQVIGVDYDAEMITEADQRALNAGVSAWVTHKRADAMALPFESNLFDACRSERLFQHLPDPAKALSEMTCVTKSGGWVDVLDTDWGTLSADASDTEIERRLMRAKAERMVDGYSGRQLYRLFKQQGLADVSAQVCSLHLTDYALARRVIGLDNVEREALALNIVTAQELERVHVYREQANTEGRFFSSGSLILASGRKP